MKTPNYIIGSVSCATMREEDLISTFLDTLAELDPERAESIREENADVIAKVGSDDLTDDDHEDISVFLNDTLFDVLNEYAPPYFYFGAHPGDGADFGFWLWEDILEEFDGLKVSDTSDVSADYFGEVLHVNDHGNMTLYAKDEGSNELREVWAIV